ncbi:MAG: putative capsular polysaccharide synthesis family protein, partial [Pseudomonadota bacterium]|nr:putative capsular polysaccharide synthesis family protein [Pseudomonadota bacterium]
MTRLRIGRTVRLYRNVAMERRRLRAALSKPIGPVVAYGHPKTATRSIESAIASLPDAEAFHAHMLHPMHFTKRNNVFVPPLPSGLCPEDQPSQWSISKAIDSNKRIMLVSAVRDPVAVNVSWFFFGLQRWLRSPRPVDPESIPFNTLQTLFHEGFPHQGILNWFTEEWERVTGAELRMIDGVRSEGHATTAVGNCRACVFSAHRPDTSKAEILAEFLGVAGDSITFPRTNLGVNRPGSDVYERLKIMVASDSRYLDSMYNSAYSRHFFSKDQIEAFRAS